jgi:hypothetical protein
MAGPVQESNMAYNAIVFEWCTAVGLKLLSEFPRQNRKQLSSRQKHQKISFKSL